MIEITLNKDSILLLLPEKVYGTVKRIGMLNNEPILYGDINVVKPGSLYYIPGAKQIYRYIKPIFRKGAKSNASIGGVQIGNPKPIPGSAPVDEYHFTTIEQTSTDSLSIPEDERGKIRNAGYLFGEIIYSGDPNLIDNGSLFYHDTLPYVSIVSNVEGIINLSTKEIDENGDVTTLTTEYYVNSETNYDYSKDYLTIEFIGDGSLTGTFEYNLNKTEWVTLDDDTVEFAQGDKVQIKGEDTSISFAVGGAFNVSGNLMSLVAGDDFEDTEITEDNQFADLFYESEINSAKNLILPSNTTIECYSGMFRRSSLVEAPKILPATTLAMGCYTAMFADCANLIKAPELPASTLETDCYTGMFCNCESLNYIKAMFTTTPNNSYTGEWVKNVAVNGTFIKNANATWNVVANMSNNWSGTPNNWTIKKEAPQYDPIDPVDDEIHI